jgi:hypothetical protein
MLIVTDMWRTSAIFNQIPGGTIAQHKDMKGGMDAACLLIIAFGLFKVVLVRVWNLGSDT